MPYTINHANTDQPAITVADQSLNEETSLKFVGKNYNGYAKSIAENFLHLLENFANDVAPANPTVGQLWYDNNFGATLRRPQLKLFDGTNWVPASNVFKDVTKPTGPTVGDLWVDISKQQLYIYSGSSNTWLLVGPQFSTGSSTGPVADKVYDTSDNPHNIIKFMVGVIRDETVTPAIVDPQVAAIMSFTSFTPKATIPGFSTINVGLNLSTSSSSSKMWGTAYQADNLLVGTTTVPAANFLRSDAASTTNYKFTIASKDGLSIGTSSITDLGNTTTGATVLHNKNADSQIILRIGDTSRTLGYRDSVAITTTNISLDAGLVDVTGNVSTTGSLTITSIADSSSLGSGSLKTSGGVSIAKKLNVGGTVTIAGTTSAASINPSSTDMYTLGVPGTRWDSIQARNVTADRFYGTLEGNLVGTIVGSASSLTTPTNFQIVGDVESQAVASNGDGSPVTFSTVLTQNAFTSRGALDPDSSLYDEILINRPTVGLKRIRKETFISNIPLVPIGAIMPFAGSVPPAGYLLCDGSARLIANYQRLYAVIGRTYSPAPSTTEFNLPDLRGRFPLGRDSMNNDNPLDTGPDRVTGADTLGASGGTESSLAAGTGGTIPTTGAAKINVMNPYLTINYIIYTGTV